MKGLLITGIGLVVLSVIAASCDSAAEQGDCPLIVDELRSRSESLLTSGSQAVAVFEFQQDVKTYETTGCKQANSDVDEVSLVVRNLTSCEQDIVFQLSFFEGQVGWSYNGTISLAPSAASPLGVISTVGNIDIENAQMLLGGQSTQGICQ